MSILMKFEEDNKKSVHEYYEQHKREDEIYSLEHQTIMFWNLQLQFMELDKWSIATISGRILDSSLYITNDHSEKMKRLLGVEPYKWTEDQRICMATHLALQLSGLGDI